MSKNEENNEKQEPSLSEKRLAELITEIESQPQGKPYVIAKYKMQRVFHTDTVNNVTRIFYTEKEKFKPREPATLAPNEYWVVKFYDGYRYRRLPVVPDWISDEQSDEWLKKWLSDSEKSYSSSGWEEPSNDYLKMERAAFECFVNTRVFTFQTKDGEKKSIRTTRENLDYEPALGRDGYEESDDDKSWRERDKSVECSESLPEGMTEDKLTLAQSAFDWLSTAIKTFTKEIPPFDPTEDEYMALTYAYMAGRAAEKYDFYGNRDIARGGAAMVDRRPPKGTRTAWRRAAYYFMKPVMEAGNKVTAKEVAEHLNGIDLANFGRDDWYDSDFELELWKDDEKGEKPYFMPWNKKSFEKEISKIRIGIKERLENKKSPI